MRLYLTILIIVGFVRMSYAQDYPRKNMDLSRIADDLFAFQDLNINYEGLYENIVQLFANPVNLNKATVEELRFLNILSEAQIQNFINYKKENGDLLTVYELQAVPGFDATTLYKIIPFVKVTDPFSVLGASWFGRAFDQDNNYFITRYERTLETTKGFHPETDSKYKFKGSNDNEYFRFRTSRPGDFSVGFTAEKDAGEQFIWRPSSNQYGFDYLSFHAQVQNKGKLKNLIVGDYQIQFGQGLMLGGVFGMGKGAETISTTRRSNLGILPYTSINESGALRGIATTYKIAPDIFITGLYSNTKQDASFASDSATEISISSIQTSGLHRNESELQNRKKIGQVNYGTVINYKKNALDAGVMFTSVEFSVPVNHVPTLYNQFAFQGTKNQNVGVFLNHTFNNVTFFSEVSKSIHAGMGAVGGILASLTKHLDISLLYRKYDANFYSFYSNAFSENTVPQDESGIYWGWKYYWNKKFTMAGYVDMFHFPWLRFRSYQPSEGHEWLARFSYQPSKQVLLFLQAREESKVRNTDSDPNLYPAATGTKQNYWINCDYGITPKLRMKTRAQFSKYQIDGSITRGSALIQDISMDIGRFGITGRYALFDTDDYDNRQYVYEQDVWLAYSLPAYYGVGVRNFILVQYTVNKKITLWLRYAHTRYTDRNEIGSGVDTIDGNTKNDVKFQILLKI